MLLCGRGGHRDDTATSCGLRRQNMKVAQPRSSDRFVLLRLAWSVSRFVIVFNFQGVSQGCRQNCLALNGMITSKLSDSVD
jgi:hypothetical protein